MISGSSGEAAIVSPELPKFPDRGARMKLSNDTVRAITLPRGKTDHIVFDNKLSGFGVRVRSGVRGIRKTWILQYRDAGLQSRRFIIGTLDELPNAAKAREIAADKLANIRLGIYPHAERAKERILAVETFESVAKVYLAAAEKRLRERSFKEVRRHIEKLWAPFADISIHDINRRMVALRITEIAAKNGPYAANHSRASSGGNVRLGDARGHRRAEPGNRNEHCD
jgi:hypothetical protein